MLPPYIEGRLIVRSPEECARAPGAWVIRGPYKVALWSLAEGGYRWEVSRASRVIERCERYDDALAAVDAHQAANAA